MLLLTVGSWLLSLLAVQVTPSLARALLAAKNGLSGHVSHPVGSFKLVHNTTMDAARHSQHQHHVLRDREAKLRHWRNSSLLGPGGLAGVEVTNDIWQHMKSKGCAYLGAMSVPDSKAGQFFPGNPPSLESPFTKYPDDLLYWGYDSDPEGDEEYAEEDGGPHVEDALRAYGLNAKKTNEEGGLNRCLSWKHVLTKTIEEKEYRLTSADFRTIVNPNHGVLIGWYKYGPAFKGSMQSPPVTLLPKLKNWSDIAFLKYKHEAEQRGISPSNLRFVFSANVNNGETEALLGRALANDPDNAPDAEPFESYTDCEGLGWANRRQFSMESSAGKALLASPNGRGAAFLLIQHKSVFGPKTTIAGVEVWCRELDDSDEDNPIHPELNFLFHVSLNWEKDG